jgi:DivIVA domain-containing protein
MAAEDRERAETASAERVEAAPLPARSESVRPEVPAEIRDVSFHRTAAGYARREVDRYVERVNALIAELEITRSPESAIKHAIAQVGEQTSGILQQAGETADQITQAASADADATVAGARSEASGIVAEATGEAEGIVESAKAQAKELRDREEQRLEELRRRADEELRKLRAETDAIRAERRQLVEGIDELAVRLKGLGDAAAEGVEPEPADDDRPSDSADHPSA